ncbi:hypothetical protein GCM10010199_26580 [Dactylosporangium roseum]
MIMESPGPDRAIPGPAATTSDGYHPRDCASLSVAQHRGCQTTARLNYAAMRRDAEFFP